ncbi:MAG: hypothetical protein GY953_47545 [bacterium]|nr:hypothetical protein [bacterium]
MGTVSASGAEPLVSHPEGRVVLERYLSRNHDQRMALRDVSMEVDIEAQLPRLEKQGRLRALRRISKLGKVTYEVLSFIGDNMIKKDVIARYMAAEVKTSGNGNRDSMIINEKNYKFKYRGMYGQGDDWRLHLFELKPRRKKAGLFEGWLWVEADSGLPVRESGRLVKNPSVFLKRVDFVRDYHARNGVAVPVRIESTIRTRLIGQAVLRIEFGDDSFNESGARLAAQTSPGQN